MGKLSAQQTCGPLGSETACGGITTLNDPDGDTELTPNEPTAVVLTGGTKYSPKFPATPSDGDTFEVLVEGDGTLEPELQGTVTYAPGVSGAVKAPGGKVWVYDSATDTLKDDASSTWIKLTPAMFGAVVTHASGVDVDEDLGDGTGGTGNLAAGLSYPGGGFPPNEIQKSAQWPLELSNVPGVDLSKPGGILFAFKVYSLEQNTCVGMAVGSVSQPVPTTGVNIFKNGTAWKVGRSQYNNISSGQGSNVADLAEFEDFAYGGHFWPFAMSSVSSVQPVLSFISWEMVDPATYECQNATAYARTNLWNSGGSRVFLYMTQTVNTALGTQLYDVEVWAKVFSGFPQEPTN